MSSRSSRKDVVGRKYIEGGQPQAAKYYMAKSLSLWMRGEVIVSMAGTSHRSSKNTETKTARTPPILPAKSSTFQTVRAIRAKRRLYIGKTRPLTVLGISRHSMSFYGIGTCSGGFCEVRRHVNDDVLNENDDMIKSLRHSRQ